MLPQTCHDGDKMLPQTCHDGDKMVPQTCHDGDKMLPQTCQVLRYAPSFYTVFKDFISYIAIQKCYAMFFFENVMTNWCLCSADILSRIGFQLLWYLPGVYWEL